MRSRWPAGWLPLLVTVCLVTLACNGGEGGRPPPEDALSLDPDNPHYLRFQGEPAVLVTSGEHYGAVVNSDFDYERYLDELAEHQFNLTRIFAGSFVEPEEPLAQLGRADPLAPERGSFVSPWDRTAEGKFDLTAWNQAYFERLRDFVAEAGERGIAVELTLFSALYEPARWAASPFNAANNVNAVGDIDESRLYTLDNGGLVEFQDAFVSKHVRELQSFGNVYYEVLNEPFERPPASDEWQAHIIETIEAAEADLPYKHLIARNYPHDSGPIRDSHPSVSVFNLHYQPDAGPYLNLDGVIALDETGLQGTGDAPYRMDAWLFLLSGGGIYSHLDWSFTPDEEGGTFELPSDAPGGGGESLRRQLSVLKRFLDRFDLPAMAPQHEVASTVPAGRTARVLADPGSSYAVYLAGGETEQLALEIPRGSYRVEWVDTANGGVVGAEGLDHPGGEASLSPPPHREDIALAVERVR